MLTGIYKNLILILKNINISCPKFAIINYAIIEIAYLLEVIIIITLGYNIISIEDIISSIVINLIQVLLNKYIQQALTSILYLYTLYCIK